ncbi:MAG: hypothetical protein NT151_06100 [Acidobacteria bacterium]|nr:hypothetical protein [Acidobacteriota bacterium]
MSTKRWIRSRGVSGLVALSLCVAAPRMLAGQGAVPTKEQAADAAAFKEFSVRVQAYVKLQKTVESKLPALKPTDLPEMITAHQQALARKIREARPKAKPGDVFTDAAREAFRHVSRTALGGPRSAQSRGYMRPDGPNPNMRLAVNGIYPDTEPITAPPPELLAAFPPLPVEVAYRVVGRTLIVMDVKSRLIVDVAREILPQAP